MFPQERVSEFFVEQAVGVPFRKSLRIPLKLWDYSLERILHRTVEEIGDVSVPLFRSRLLK